MRLLAPIILWCLLALCRNGHAESATCETALIALRKGALELETRLKKCKSEEKQRCDDLIGSTQNDLAREKDVSQRLRELLSAKDLEKSVALKEIESGLKTELAKVRDENSDLRAELEEQRRDASRAKQLTEELVDEKKKTAALVYSLNECKESFEKKTTDAVTALNAKVQKQAFKIDSLTETLEARNAEVETLRKLVVKLEEQNRAGFLEWFNKPGSLESLLDASNRTMELLAPGLGATERRLLELRAMSSAKIESLIGDHDTSILMSTLLAWGILLIPFFLSFCLLVRVRLSLSKMVLWASLYAALFCLVMFGFSFALGREALGSLRRMSILSHDILLILIMVGHILQILSMYLLTLKQWLVSDLGSLRARHMLQFAIPVLVAGHYYYYYYFSAISAAEGDDEGGDGPKAEFDANYWMAYALGYFFLCVLVVLGTSSSSAVSSPSAQVINHPIGSAPQKPSVAVETAANVVTSLVNAVEGQNSNVGDDSSDVMTSAIEKDVEAGSSTSGHASHATTEKQKKKKKKAKDSSMEFLGPDEVLDAVVSATRQAKSDEKGD